MEIVSYNVKGVDTNSRDRQMKYSKHIYWSSDTFILFTYFLSQLFSTDRLHLKVEINFLNKMKTCHYVMVDLTFTYSDLSILPLARLVNKSKLTSKMDK